MSKFRIEVPTGQYHVYEIEAEDKYTALDEFLKKVEEEGESFLDSYIDTDYYDIDYSEWWIERITE